MTTSFWLRAAVLRANDGNSSTTTRPERSRLMASSTAWLPALRRYFCVIAVGNLAWEFAQLPLYTLWQSGSAYQIGFAVVHCTGGDVLIAGAALLGSLLVLGAGNWPRTRFAPVAGAALVTGIGVTAYLEHLNTTRGVWTYSDLMPVFPGTGIGLAPLLQWIVVPILALAAARPVYRARSGDFSTEGSSLSGTVPRHVARSDRSS